MYYTYCRCSLETRPSPSSAIIITLTFEASVTALGFKGQRNNNNRGGGRRPGFEATEYCMLYTSFFIRCGGRRVPVPVRTCGREAIIGRICSDFSRGIYRVVLE